MHHCIVSKNWTPSHTSKPLNLPIDHPAKVLAGNVCAIPKVEMALVSALPII